MSINNEKSNFVKRCIKFTLRHKTIVIDEKYVYLADVASKENIQAWVDSAGERPMWQAILTSHFITFTFSRKMQKDI